MSRLRLLLAVAALAAWAAPAQAQAQASPWSIFLSTTNRLAHATTALPRLAVVHWRVTLPLVVGTGAMIAFGDARLSSHIQSPGLERNSRLWSDRGLLYIEPAFVLSAAAFENHCLFCASTGRFAMLALTAEAYNTAAVQAVKYGTGRERPYTALDGDGGFNEAGRSFPSGHAAAAFTLASLLAHTDPQAHWMNRTAYLLASGVAGLRFTGKEHFPSDILVGAAFGNYLGGQAATFRLGPTPTPPPPPASPH